MKGDNSLTKWKASPCVRTTASGDGAVLLDIDAGMCYSLNPVGTKVWEAVVAGKGYSTCADVLDVLAQEFTIPREQFAADVDNYLRELEQKRLVTSDGGANLLKASRRR
jgi:coenzyme PQQ synthesis protein D (PqqD)